MKKNYIRMNNNDENLSLGNLFRIIKELSKNKLSALQSELFCTLFEIEGINDTTVNNYCVGCRGIGNEYKQIFLNKEKRYEKNREEFTDNVIGILNIIDGVIHNITINKIDFINCNDSAAKLARKLYNLAKNDNQVSNDFVNKLCVLLNDNNFYECLVWELLFVVLHKKQPIYEDVLKKEVLENVLNDTSISSIDLQEYLSLKLREGINFDYSMRELASNGNAYACFEIGSNEYYGYVIGYPRYDVAFRYLKQAADLNHSSANYMIGNMYIRGIIGSKSNDELEKGYKYLVKSYELGNIAASNLLGNMYYEGIYPLKKNKDKALELFKKASLNNYAYAYNNLGKLALEDNDTLGAFKYFIVAADLGESWACNKVGEFYRQGIVEKNMEKAYYYYNKALESNYRTLCYYAYYNLAKYFYKFGYDGIVLKKDINKYLEYLEIAASHNIFDALLELFDYYIEDYLNSFEKDIYDKIIDLKEKIECNKKFNKQISLDIENKINMLVEKKRIDLCKLEEIKDKVSN